MRPFLPLLTTFAAACFPVPEPDDTATDTGAASTCDGWTIPGVPGDTPTATPTTTTTGATGTSTSTPAPVCPGGGTADDLVAGVIVTAPDGTTCGACEAVEVESAVQVYNPCPVDVEIDDGCRAFGGVLTNQTTGWSAEFIAECYPTTGSSSTLTVPAGGWVPWYDDSWGSLDPGEYTLEYDLAVVPDVATAFCLSAP